MCGIPLPTLQGVWTQETVAPSYSYPPQPLSQKKASNAIIEQDKGQLNP